MSNFRYDYMNQNVGNYGYGNMNPNYGYPQANQQPGINNKIILNLYLLPITLLNKG